MKQSAFNKKIRPACAYCAVGKPTEDSAHILCIKKGVMQPDSSCRAFQYDVLRREPQKKAELPTFDASEFSIE